MNPPDAASAARIGSPLPQPRFRLLLTLVVALAATVVLAACGGEDSSDSSGSSASAEAPDVSRIAQLIEPVDPKTSGKGETIDLGVALALSGDGAFYGANQLKAVELAVKQIEQLGGPSFQIVEKDHEGGMPQAGARAGKELAAADVPVVLSSYSAGGGAMLPAIARSGMLTFDPGGGTSVWAQGQPYFYGTRTNAPTDTYPGVVKYLNEQMPEVKRVSMVAWDLGGELNEVLEGDARSALEEGGIELVNYETVPAGTTDYAAAIQRIKSDDPDLLLSYIWGLDLGNFVKALAAAGVSTPHIGSDFSEEAAEAAGPALNGYMFSYEYFDPDQPPNEWAKMFVDAFRAEYGTDPDFYAANFYESTFALWRVIQRTLAAGGEIEDGADLVKAIEANPSFDSLYGGEGDEAGTLKLDLESHSVAQRPMGLFEYEDGEITTLATFDLDGANYKANGN